MGGPQLLLALAVAVVQFVHPLNRQLEDQGEYVDCDRCNDICQRFYLSLQAMASMIEVYSRVRGAQGDNRFVIISVFVLVIVITR